MSLILYSSAMTKWKNLELISVRKCSSLSKVEEEEYKPAIGVNKEEEERQMRRKVEEKMIKPEGPQTQPSASTDEAEKNQGNHRNEKAVKHFK